MAKMAPKGSERRAITSGAAVSDWPHDKVCDTCWNAGWVMEDGALAHCPECGGASNVARNSKAAVKAMLAREHAITAAEREKHGLPPLGKRVVELLPKDGPGPPPDDFARSGVPIPTTVTEEQREVARARLAAATAALAGKVQR